MDQIPYVALVMEVKCLYVEEDGTFSPAGWSTVSIYKMCLN